MLRSAVIAFAILPGAAAADVCDLSLPRATELIENDGATWTRRQFVEFIYFDTTGAVIPTPLYEIPPATSVHFDLPGLDGQMVVDLGEDDPIAIAVNTAAAQDWGETGPGVMSLLTSANAEANTAGLFNPCDFASTVTALGQWTIDATTVQEVFILSDPNTMLNLQILRSGTSALGRIYILEGG